MTVGSNPQAPVPAGWTTPLPAGVGRLLQEARGGGQGLSAVAVQGPGGTGKSLLLTQLASAYRRAGIPVVDVRDAPPVSDLDGDVAVIVDDAQRLTPERADRVRELIGHPRARVALAYRPWPRPPALAELVREMAGDRYMVVLGHLTREAVQSWATAELGALATPRLVDFVLHQTGGLPALVAHLLGCLARDVADPAEARPSARPGPGAARRLEVPGEVLDRVRGDLVALDDEERGLLHALAAGSPLDTDVLGDLLELSPRRAADLVTRARAGGLLLAEGTVVPLVQDALLQETPADLTRGTRRRLLGLLLDRGEEPLDLARALAADRVREPRAARLLERHGTAALTTAPEVAADLLGLAADAGAPTGRLAARRAQAAALTGDLDGALQWADHGLTDEEATDRGRAAGVAATVLAQRGLLARSAELFALAGPERSGSAALALLATGAAAEAAAVLQSAAEAPSRGAPTSLAGGEWLMAQGVLRSLRRGTSAAEDIAASLSVLTRAAALVEPAGRTALLPDTPAALAALVALHSGELGVAESVLRRALDAGVGGPPARARHLLLLAWTAMLRGRLGAAREHLAEAPPGGTGRLEPRDELFARALEVGLARRSSDSPALTAAWEPAREALLRHPVDLFGLLPLGELVIAGSRMKDAGRLAPHLAEARALLDRLGNPQLWAAPLHWSGVQAAILADDPAALEPHAAALAAAARTSPYAATVAQAGRSWLRVLTGDVDAATAVTAATDLAAVGLAWDGSRLAGQAAARATDPRDRLALLQCARSLAGPEETGAAGPPPAAAHPAPRPEDAQLSQRERDVAALVVAGKTYREIGERLYISAKTVEHHVARMRQRLGADSRSDLIARLQAELG